MFFSNSTVFGIYSRRVMTIMIARISEMLGSLLSFSCHHLTELALYPAVILPILWFINAQEDSPIASEPVWKPDLASGLGSVGPALEKDLILVQADGPGTERDSRCCCQKHCQSALVGVPVSQTTSDRPSEQIPKLPPASLRNVQPKTSFLDLRLNDISNRLLQDSIWATPAKAAPAPEKTPTQKSYNNNVKDAQTQRGHAQNEDELCSNKATHTTEKRSVAEKMKAFERKNMGITPWLEDALRAPKDGPLRLRGRRSYPRLRHSVLTWWAGVEQQQASRAELPMDLELLSEPEEQSDCSVQPWDSWSAVVHNLRSANAQDTVTKMRHIAMPS